MSWLLAFLGFSLLIILHELGHFAAAKAVGMRVEKFSVFFGPMLVKWRRGETVYGIGPIPAGGYVKISGMNPREELPPEVQPRAYYRQPVWKRLFVIGAGPFMSLLTAFVLIWGVFVVDGQRLPGVGEIERGSPAAGILQPGDALVAVDGREGGATQLAEQIQRHRCAGRPRQGCAATTPARVTVERGGERRTLAVTPRYDAEVDPPRMRLGFAFDRDGVPVQLGPGEATGESVSGMWRITTLTVSTIGRVLFDSEARKDTSSVVGAYEVTRQSFQFSTSQAIFLLGFISLSLGIINLFPFLPLDGGHIFWAVAEKVRGRAIPFSLMERASVVGFVLVMFLFVIGLTNDINRITGEGFGVR
jgi:regulator of sigma E protease